MAMDMVTATARKRNLPIAFSASTTFTLLVGCLSVPAMAGEWTITPSVALNETATDNVDLSRSNKQADLVTDATLGFHINGSGGRTKLDLDYQLHNLFYAQHSSRNQAQNYLNASGTVEAIDNWFFIDASGTITQQNVSPFLGVTSSTVNANTDSNTRETSTFSLSPNIRGTLGGVADYALRYSLETTKTQANSAYNSDSRVLELNLDGITDQATLGWSIDASSRNSKSGNNRSYRADNLRGTLTYPLTYQFRASLIAGREANDYLSQEKQSHPIKGVGFDWSPGARTQLSASTENRYFGNSHKIDFTHRTAGTAWTYSESKDATERPNQRSTLGVGTNYDLLFNLYASAIPDPVARAAYVNALLLSNGLSPNAQLQGGFLTSGVAIQTARELSFAITGVRNTVTFAASQSKTSNLSSVGNSGLLIGEDLTVFQDVRQRGISINWSHKLTPFSTLVAMVSRLQSKGSGTSSVSTTQTKFNLNYLVQLSPQTSVSLGLRRDISNYTENAVTATLSHQF